MTANLRPVSERLYLQRDDIDEIYVESPLHQHHIDGIRFLFKQFKKQKFGVILNNPLGYGNSMQVALFLGAIRHLLEKPVLILCEQSEELNWLEHFQKLTQCYSVGVAAPSPFVKKSIFINTMDNLAQFCRRDWSVLVVDNDAFLKEKALLAKFKADFKIWITPLDMKDHLQMFSSIFKWIFPKEKLNLEDFKPKPGDRRDAVAKSVLLEAFFEDIVCRTTLQTPSENTLKFEESPRKSSKKNKDVTGTKVKRSKRALESADTFTAPENSETEAVGRGVKKSRSDDSDSTDFNISNFKNSENNKCGDKDNNEGDVESFIRDEPIKYDPFNFLPALNSVSRGNQGSKTEFMVDEANFDTSEHLNRLLEAEVPMEIAANPEVCFIDSDTNSDSLLSARKSFDNNTSQLSNDSECGDRKQTTTEFHTDNILNGIKDDMTDNVTKIDEDAVEFESDKVEKKADDKVREEPTKNDLDSMIREMDERAFKKFQGSILDRLF